MARKKARRVKCEICGKTFGGPGIGAHRKSCRKNDGSVRPQSAEERLRKCLRDIVARAIMEIT